MKFLKNKKHFLKSTTLFIALLAGLFLGSTQAVSAGGDNTPQSQNCYGRLLSDKVEKTPTCNYQGLSELGYEMGNLPNPLDPNKCYFWEKEATAVGMEISCDDERLANATEYGSNNPAPPTIENASGQVEAKNRAERSQDPGGITSEQRNQLSRCDATDGSGNIDQAAAQSCLADNPIIVFFLKAIEILAAGVGVVATIVIIIAGIQYSSAGGDPQKVKAAKTRITNAIIGLIAYFFLFAFLQWIVPGGYF